MKQQILTQEEAFAAMQKFLEIYWERGQSEEIAILLGGLMLQADGKCADPALWDDWLQSIDEIKKTLG